MHALRAPIGEPDRAKHDGASDTVRFAGLADPLNEHDADLADPRPAHLQLARSTSGSTAPDGASRRRAAERAASRASDLQCSLAVPQSAIACSFPAATMTDAAHHAMAWDSPS
jgi:hypothetical protein